MSARLAFGTAGIRAAMGEGPDRLNVLTVRLIVQAVLQEAQRAWPDAAERGVCVGFDGRAHSAEFAEAATRQALTLGFRTASFGAPLPTPLLAFTTRDRDAAIGLMITASHNPAHENGVKVYWRGGTQITAPWDERIAARLVSLGEDELLPVTSDAVYETLGEPEIERYLSAVCAQLAGPPRAPLTLAYSALAGVGAGLTRRLLRQHTEHVLHEVETQAEPRTDFAGLSSPNPEHAAALSEVLALGERVRADLILAHDPDADRLAVAVPTPESALVLSGDEVGTLLGDGLLARAPDPRREVLASTLVSSPWLTRVAAHHGAQLERTLTGFKWIMTRGRERAEREGCHFLFGYEEAIGYALADLSEDKDGLMALMLVAEQAATLKAEGRTLLDELERLARRDGLHASYQLTLPLADASGAALASFLSALKQSDISLLIGQARGTWSTPSPTLHILADDCGNQLCVRPSGTEPKLKIYLHARAQLDAHESYLSGRTRLRGALAERAGRIAKLA